LTGTGGNPTNSPFYVSLNGDWKFNWRPGRAAADQLFESLRRHNDEHRVPSNWEMKARLPIYLGSGTLQNRPRE